MKKSVLVLFAVILSLGLFACSNQNSQVSKNEQTKVTDGGPRYTGKILTIDPSNKKILLEGNKDCGDFWFTVTNETSLKNSSEEKIAFDYLKVGDKVDTWFTGSFSLNCSSGKSVQKDEYKLAFLRDKN